MRTFQTVNPRTGLLIDKYSDANESELEDVLDKLHAGYTSWKSSPLAERQELIHRIAHALSLHKPRLAQLASTEMGKLLPEALGEVDKCISLCTYVAKALPKALAATKVDHSQAYARVQYRPLGCILGIMPWNFPFWQVVRFAIPALAAGNVVLVKHADNVAGSAQLLLDIIAEACSNFLAANIRLSTERTEALIADQRIAAVSLTGSTKAGRAVGSAAGKALKPSLLELGGSDPYLILADADLDLAVAECFAGRLLNAGQSCISPKRIIIHHDIYESFVAKLTAKVKDVPFAQTTYEGDTKGQLAPLARRDLQQSLHRQVSQSVAQGARLACGGYLPEAAGFYYPATILADVQQSHLAAKQELFGPVFSLFRSSSDQQAISIANDSDFGLGGAVFSKDISRATEIADQLNVGACFINSFVKSNPTMPFGGIKDSGYGRELGLEGIRSFCNIKTLVVAH